MVIRKRNAINTPPAPYEAEAQAMLFQWAAMQECVYPELRLMYSIPNGGSRHPAEAANLRRQGVKAGVPDICLPVPRGEYAALFIELKREKTGKLSSNQRTFGAELSSAGNKVAVCYGFEAAQKVITDYLTQNERDRSA
ncbi:hypothetical protein AGMMS49992_26910 [Clostridia bacterium]|nr:hypothetical protein AGMMS49992_26910 [Clostridia bacterium]